MAATTVRTTPVAVPRAIATMPLATVGTIHLVPIRIAAHLLGIRIIETKLGFGRHDLVAVGPHRPLAELIRLVAQYAIDIDAALATPITRPSLLRRIVARLQGRRAVR